MPVPKVPPITKVREKWKKRVGVAGPDYEAGVTTPVRDWLEEFADAIDRIHEGLTEAMGEGRILGGARRVGTTYWKAQATRKGPPRWRDETPKRDAEYAKEFGDFLSEIGTVTIEKKRRKGDPANVSGRVLPIALALHELKKRKRAGGS